MSAPVCHPHLFFSCERELSRGPFASLAAPSSCTAKHTRPETDRRAEPRRTKAETSDADVGLSQTKEQFIQCLDTAMQSEPKPLSSDERYRLTWEVRVVGVVPHRLSRSRCTQAEAILPQG